MKNLRVLFFLSFMVFLVPLASKAAIPSEKESSTCAVCKLRKEITDITLKQKELIYETKKEIRTRDALKEDIDEAIRKIESHEITDITNSELLNVYKRDKDLPNKSENRKKRNNDLLRRKALVDCRLKKDPQLKSLLSNLMNDLNRATNEWNFLLKEEENSKILYNEKRKAILDKLSEVEKLKITETLKQKIRTLQNKSIQLNSKKKVSISPIEKLGRIPPQARELEEAILGALMLEKDAYSMVSEILTPQSFYGRANELIFAAIQDLAMKQEPIDLLTVVEQLKRNGTLKESGGASHISLLSQKVVSSAHLEYHARIVAQKALARQLISFSSTITDKAFDETVDVGDLMQEAEAQLFKISQQNLKKDFTQIAPLVRKGVHLIQEAAKRPDGLSGLQSGFDEIDRITCGWQNSDLIIIAGRPSMGKTAFVLSMAKNMAIDFKIPVAIFSLEMSDIQLINRLIINVSEINGEKIKRGRLERHEWAQLDEKIKLLSDAPIIVDDTPNLSIFELRTKARRSVKDHKVKCIIVDYLQLMNASGMNFNSREQEVSIISRSLKSLAKELDIPIIALSQLNRNVENRSLSFDTKRPQLSDLRESGAIEQDADVVCFIHRPEKYKILEDTNGNDLRGKAEIIIAKHRNGSTDDVMLSFKQEYIRFQNLKEDNQTVAEYHSHFNNEF